MEEGENSGATKLVASVLHEYDVIDDKETGIKDEVRLTGISNFLFLCIIIFGHVDFPNIVLSES